MTASQWWDLKASEINALPRPETVAIVPVASTEQHGPHLPTQVDCILVGEIARRAAARAETSGPVVVTPVIWTGIAEHHMGLGGTVSLDFATFAAPIATATYWLLAREAFGRILEDQKNVRHACEAETSMMLALRPDLVDMGQAQQAVGPTSPEIVDIVGSDGAHRWQSFQVRTTHGAIGDPRRASAEKGERLLEAAANAVADLIGKTDFWTAPA